MIAACVGDIFRYAIFHIYFYKIQKGKSHTKPGKNYIPDIKSPQETATDLIMHTAEVEEIHETGSHLKQVFTGKIISHKKHPDADTLNICQVETCGETHQIICGAPNVADNLIVAVALPGAALTPDFVIKKTKIRGQESCGMLCSEDELGLTDIRQEGILELPSDTPLGITMQEYLQFDDVVLEIDNKAINHRPDLFSHIGIAREIAAINGNALEYEYKNIDLKKYSQLDISVEISDLVPRYLGVSLTGVQNTDTPKHIQQVLASHEIESKGILVDISNYALYLYGQPTHCFDANKINGNIHVRFAEDGENFEALNAKSYTLTSEDIVIADDTGVIALGGIIGGAHSAVSETTQNIIIEAACFHHATVRKTGKRLGLRTDALNVFEKDLTTEMQPGAVALMIEELKNIFPNLTIEAVGDIYPNPSSEIHIEFHLDRINTLIGKQYSENSVVKILSNLGIKKQDNILMVPFWRTDLSNIADIAEEIARINGYDHIKATIPRVNLGAITQSPLFHAKRDVRNMLAANGFFEMYTYSFVDTTLMNKALGDTQNLVPMKNALSEEMTHLRGSLIPNLLQALEDNSREFSTIKLFEQEKVFSRISQSSVSEHIELGAVIETGSDNAYFEIQNTLNLLLQKLGIKNWEFKNSADIPCFAHAGRTADIIVRGKSIGTLGEIHPKVLKNFGLKYRVGYFALNMNLLENSLYSLISATELSSFQMNNFDINFVVSKDTEGSKIKTIIQKTDPYIQKVELFDIYESEEKLPGQRSLTFKVYTQSMTETLSDEYKNDLIQKIITRVEKVGGSLR